MWSTVWLQDDKLHVKCAGQCEPLDQLSRTSRVVLTVDKWFHYDLTTLSQAGSYFTIELASSSSPLLSHRQSAAISTRMSVGEICGKKAERPWFVIDRKRRSKRSPCLMSKIFFPVLIVHPLRPLRPPSRSRSRSCHVSVFPTRSNLCPEPFLSLYHHHGRVAPFRRMGWMKRHFSHPRNAK